MKIGILTYHRSHNYGALLQAIATRIVLEQMGHEVHYVDYWPKYHRHMYALINWRNIFSRHIDKVYAYITQNLMKTFRNRKLRINNMESFIARYIQPYCLSDQDEFDVVIYGSDQIWRKQPNISTYNPMYFGANNIRCKRHVSFSASMGLLPQAPKDNEIVRTLVSHLNKISVREVDLKNYLNRLGFTNVAVTLDPTLLLSHKQWDTILNIGNDSPTNDDYILYYNLMPNSFDIEKIRDFAKSHHCALRILYGVPIKQETYEEICSAAPNDFVELIRKSRFVFTSSFHGLVFSIIYNKPFWASFSKNEGRAKSILEQLGISERLLPPMSQIPHIYHPIDYPNVMKRLNLLQQESIAYLKDALNNNY